MVGAIADSIAVAKAILAMIGSKKTKNQRSAESLQSRQRLMLGHRYIAKPP